MLGGVDVKSLLVGVRVIIQFVSRLYAKCSNLGKRHSELKLDDDAYRVG